MTEAITEIEDQIATAQADLQTTLKKREEAERSIAATEQALAEHRQALQVMLNREGQLRGQIGDLTRALDALRSTS